MWTALSHTFRTPVPSLAVETLVRPDHMLSLTVKKTVILFDKPLQKAINNDNRFRAIQERSAIRASKEAVKCSFTRAKRLVPIYCRIRNRERQADVWLQLFKKPFARRQRFVSTSFSGCEALAPSKQTKQKR